ncbi:sulfite exporter TauE/SafE family protein [Acinetobacter sp. MD2]|uniref:sulfite exporter TauE/SafE family protein n=1 Tax=Acinetobacter sp. MD2 TaxID=2600066 RepID=UPI002D1F0C46|nr:sulfite exporter TauE/SafE family protein [Acinetobacter sp. MD2]MEB3768290.1 sulfite exporter TauE/SafE family protein [Acinetobacter sp. MD2]
MFISIMVVVFGLAGLIKGLIGLGLPTVSMGLLSLIMSPLQAAALLIIPSMLTNLWQLLAEGRIGFFIRRFWTLLLGIVVGAQWSFLPSLGHGKISELLLGIMLLLYGIYGLVAKDLPNLAAYEKYLSPFVGYLGGALTVATGVIIIPIVPYLQTLHLKRDQLIQALGLSFTASNICLAIFLQQHIVQNSMQFAWACFAVLPAILGMWLGKELRQHLNERRFRQYFFIGLIALGAYMSFPNLGFT